MTAPQDNTAELAGAEGVKVIRLPENMGYGAALKAGIAKSKYDLIVITDADGTYPANQIPVLVAQMEGYDMVVGARTSDNVAIPLMRRPAKWVLGKLAGYLAGRPIPDLNSGLRVMRKDLIRRFLHLLPQGFSFTTTITLSALCSGSLVKYSEIDYHARIGQSKIRPFHAFEFLLLIVRTIVYFNPLKIFLPLGGFFFLIGISRIIKCLYRQSLGISAVGGIRCCGVLVARDVVGSDIQILHAAKGYMIKDFYQGLLGAPSSRAAKRLKVLLRAFMSLLILSLLLRWLPIATLWMAIKSIPALTWLLIFTGFITGHVVAAFKWRLLLSAVGLQVPALDVIKAHGAGLFPNLCLPSVVGGDFVRAGVVIRQQGNAEAIALGSLADRINDTVALLLIAATASFFVPPAMDVRTNEVLSFMTIILSFGNVAGILFIRFVPEELIPGFVRYVVRDSE